MSSLTVRIRIVRILGGKYKVDKLKVCDDHEHRVDITKVPIEDQREFPNKNEAREHGAQLANRYITSKYAEGTRYEIEWKTRVEIPQEVAGASLASGPS